MIGKKQSCKLQQETNNKEHMSQGMLPDRNIQMSFYKCDICNQIVASSKRLKNPLSCCNQSMKLLMPDSGDGELEKHVPMYHIDDHRLHVCVGMNLHPMTEEHYIEWICVVTSCRTLWMPLEPNMPPTASFRIGSQEEVKEIYAYCNIHELWVNVVKKK